MRPSCNRIYTGVRHGPFEVLRGVRVGIHFRLASASFEGWDRLYPHYVAQAEAADKLGFDCITVAEHHFQEDGYIPSPYVVLGGFATRTSSIRLATGVRPLPMIHPARAAEDIAVLDNLSGGRAIAGAFGLGGRPREYTGFGISFPERRARYEESIELVSRFLSEEAVVHAGRFFEIDALTVTPRPVQRPRPPLWLAGSADSAVRRAARIADGWMCKPGESKQDLVRLAAVYRDELDRHGRTGLTGQIVRRDAWLAASADAAWAEALPALHFHYTRDYAHIPDDATLDDIRAYGEDRFLIGDAEHFVNELRWYRDVVGASIVVLGIDHPGLKPDAVLRTLQMIGTDVLPLLRE
jgi:alkanesulfonate monooxygenase SsuD/methylene tetrahydromethanopterin reductase-like flavin-dependent oxidoreductase (luciferase family)